MLVVIVQGLMVCRTSPDHFLVQLHFFRVANYTIERMTTHGKLRDATIARASDVFPDPELPATPIMLVFAHGGE
jgi:hypothetical protein